MVKDKNKILNTIDVINKGELFVFKLLINIFLENDFLESDLYK